MVIEVAAEALQIMLQDEGVEEIRILKLHRDIPREGDQTEIRIPGVESVRRRIP